jgi:formylglycine-generating enzyme required for sulfatase activity
MRGGSMKKTSLICSVILFGAVLLLTTGCKNAGNTGGEAQDEDGSGTISVTGVSLDKGSVTLSPGDNEKLTATVEPGDATDKSVSWESDDEGVATVDADGLVTGVANGATTITVTTNDGGFTESCDVTVETWKTSQSGSVSLVGSSITYTNHQYNFSFKVKACPGGTFPTGTDDNGDINDDGTQDVSPTATVNSFWISETEVTYELWYAVKEWAENMANPSYTFANDGREGNDGNDGVSPTNADQEPVTEIHWRDAMIWCNALTEYYNAQNGNNYMCVYYSDVDYHTPIRTSTNDAVDNPLVSGEEDQPYIKAATDGNTDMANCTADGFRLPTMNEWEIASRWRDDSTNTVSTYSDPWFTKGNSASGATTFHDDTADVNPANGVVDGKDANDAVAVYNRYYDGSTWPMKGVTVTAVVKSKAANSLGIYDMSGNVYELCFDWHQDYVGSHRVNRGGYYYGHSHSLRVGFVNFFIPNDGQKYIGFRFARTP